MEKFSKILTNKKFLSILRAPSTILIALLILMVIAFFVRTYRIDNPVADWHSWRQADTAAVSRNFAKDKFNPFFPQYDALNPLNSNGMPNPNRYFFAEFPLYNIITYYAYAAFGINEIYARLISIIFATLTIPVLYLLTSIYSSRRIALIASFVFALLPYNIYYGRVIMPDPMYIFFSVLSLYLVSKWLTKGSRLTVPFAAIALAFAILTKPYALVLLIPIGFLLYKKWKGALFSKPSVYVFFLLSLLPFLLWRFHIMSHPEGMFATDWLYNSGGIRFTGAFFRWLIYDRLNRLIFATGGFVLFFIGIIRVSKNKDGYFYLFWLLSILVFFAIIAKGNVTHDYYQLPIVPIGCIFIAIGLDNLIFKKSSIANWAIRGIIGIILLLAMFAFGWFEVRDYFNINRREIVEAGKAVDRLLPKDAIVIAPYDNDSAFLYQTNRHGYTYGGDRITKYFHEGATHLVSVNYDDTTNYWMNQCHVVEKVDAYVIVDLTDCKHGTKYFPDK